MSNVSCETVTGKRPLCALILLIALAGRFLESSFSSVYTSAWAALTAACASVPLAVIDIYVSIAKKSAVAVAADEAVPVEEAAADEPDWFGIKRQPDKRKAEKTSSTHARYFTAATLADTIDRLQVI